jgi:hypothetical protein
MNYRTRRPVCGEMSYQFQTAEKRFVTCGRCERLIERGFKNPNPAILNRFTQKLTMSRVKIKPSKVKYDNPKKKENKFRYKGQDWSDVVPEEFRKKKRR